MTTAITTKTGGSRERDLKKVIQIFICKRWCLQICDKWKYWQI